MHWPLISEQIAAASGKHFSPSAPRSVGGGCINSAYQLADGERAFFVKLNQGETLAMFEAEAAGLAELAAADGPRVPQPLCTGIAGGQAFIAMEWIDLGRQRGDSAAEAGRQLAQMHRRTREHFGWEQDNTIGSTAQPNTLNADWVAFWREQRLGFQLKLAARHGHGGRLQERGARLLEVLPVLLNHAPEPSLLHGDLWGGNIGYDSQGAPVIFDPAVYFGDREADLAMTELFGGFGADFYAAYREAWPLSSGYSTRKSLYNLYHILNHLNLFGRGYLSQAEGLIERLLAEARG
ncbi:fructosamine kinase family protein [Thiorhodovibrio frisius]|uniref:Fructosamine-3-kinase n=1 Tax=Thiorhodovibrio frisius TaxID=631362 RepID=H8YZ45_9GAMM|nr:fructosamine kinase family protein [Thiorhodovibrio frisius]EIC21972.1 fructosamine-3-kinase [Thiorhodovibrio frisius]WPL24261.1 Fructosamine-3-kinase [Thiorhodovibrio frisius]